MYLRKTGVLLLLAALSIGCGSQSTSGNIGELKFAPDNGGIMLPEGFRAVVVADSLGAARHITVGDNGDIYIILSRHENGNGMVALRDTDDDGIADQREYFSDITGTGIQLYEGYLYASTDTSVVRFALDGDHLVPSSAPEIVIEGFPKQNSHAAKPFTFDDDGHIYVNVGAPSNACQEQTRTPGSPGQDPCPQLERHGGIWQFNARETGQTQQNNGSRYASGIRNAVALDWSSQAGNLYVAQHGRDQLNQLWPDYYDEKDNAELPAEELLLVKEGSVFGWPYTYYDSQKDARMVSPEYGGDGKKVAEEGKYPDPVLVFPGHWAPNDLQFYEAGQFPEKYHNGAFIAFHGSWNRAPLPQQGYNVAFVPFEGETPSGDYEIFADGFKGAETLDSPGNAVHRPVGLAIGPDGSLYISDSVRGTIWRVVYTGS